MVEVKSDCGAVGLLAAIFGKDANKLKQHYGLPPKPYPYRCLDCGKILSNKWGRCRECYIKSRQVKVVCSECGEAFEIQQSDLITRTNLGYQHFFCNRQCFGRYAGKHYGFVVHPENTRKIGQKRKWDYSKVYQLSDSGMNGMQISRKLGIPNPTVYVILAKRNGEKG